MSMDMQSFQCKMPPLRLFQGDACLSNLAPELRRLGCKRAVIVCGSSMQRQDHLLQRVRGALGGYFAGVIVGVREHSPLPSVVETSNELARLQADAVIAIGGGSAIVTARAATILLAEGTDARNLCTAPDGKGGLISPRLMAPKLPQIVVPTTPTTAIVKAGSAVLDPETGHRLALFDPKTRATAIFLDPEMLQSAPRSLVASASLNAFAMSIEGLMSRVGNPIADAALMHALRLLDAGIDAFAGDDRQKIRGDLAIAAILCGQGTDHTGAGATTVLGHAIGIRHGVDNGLVNAIVLPHLVRFNAEHATAGLQKVAASIALSHDDHLPMLGKILQRIELLTQGVTSACRLRDVGVPFDGLQNIAEASANDWFLRNNARPVTDPVQLYTIMRQAW